MSGKQKRTASYDSPYRRTRQGATGGLKRHFTIKDLNELVDTYAKQYAARLRKQGGKVSKLRKA